MTSRPDIKAIVLAARILHHLGKQTGVFPYTIYSDWKHLLPDIYFEHYDETDIFNAIDISFKEKWTEEKIKDLIGILEEEDRLVISQLVYTFLYLLKNSGNIIAWKRLRDAYETQFLNSELNLPGEKGVSVQVEEWLEKKEKSGFRPVISVRVSMLMVLLDFGLRSFSLFLRNTGAIPELKDIGVFVGLVNCLIIPSTVLVVGVIYRAYINRTIHIKLERLSLSHIKITPFIGAWDYFLISVLSIVGITLGELAIDKFSDGSMILFSSLIFLEFLWYVILLRYFSLPVPTSKQIYQKLKDRDQIEIEEDLTSDENDIEIVNLEVRLRSLSEKMNAFVLEAALFGALAFSGFIQIIAAEIFNLEAFGEFNSTVIELLRDLVAGDTSQLEYHFGMLLHRNTLLSLLCYESLFCSICFLSVIASRMRYSDLTDLLDKALELSKNFNKKEEGLIIHQNKSKDSEEVKVYGTKIKENLQEGMKDYNKIVPVLEYMRFFRTLGIGTFFIIIITGGLFISPLVAFIFMEIFLLSFVYFKFTQIKSWFIRFRTMVQEERAKTEKVVILLFGLFTLLVTIYRTYYLPGSSFLGMLILILLGIHQLSLLIEGKRFRFTDVRFSRFLRIGLMLLFVGLALKWRHLPGASLALIIGCTVLALFFTFHPVREERKLIIRIVGIGTSLAIMGFLFKVQHWPGANLMRYIGFFVIIGILLYTLYKRSFRLLPGFYRATLVVLIIIGFQAVLFHGIGFKLMARMNWDFTEAKKEFRFLDLRDDFRKDTQASFGDPPYNANKDQRVKEYFDQFIQKIDWAKNEPIWGSMYMNDMSESWSYFYENGKRDTLSYAHYMRLSDFNLEVIESIKEANENYLSTSGYSRNSLLFMGFVNQAVFLANLEQFETSEQYLSYCRDSVEYDEFDETHYIEPIERFILEKRLSSVFIPKVKNRLELKPLTQKDSLKLMTGESKDEQDYLDPLNVIMEDLPE